MSKKEYSKPFKKLGNTNIGPQKTSEQLGKAFEKICISKIWKKTVHTKKWPITKSQSRFRTIAHTPFFQWLSEIMLKNFKAQTQALLLLCNLELRDYQVLLGLNATIAFSLTTNFTSEWEHLRSLRNEQEKLEKVTLEIRNTSRTRAQKRSSKTNCMLLTHMFTTIASYFVRQQLNTFLQNSSSSRTEKIRPIQFKFFEY